MNVYNLIEYSDNYSDCTGSLYQFKRQEPLDDNANLTIAGSSSFNYKPTLLGDATPEGGNAVSKNAKIVVPLKYISSFFRSLEIPLINSKNLIISNVAGDSTFKITKTELYVAVVTLNTEDNNKLLDGEFKRKVYWNEYKSKIEDVEQTANNTVFKRSLLDAKIPGVYRLFIFAFSDPALRIVIGNIFFHH